MMESNRLTFLVIGVVVISMLARCSPKDPLEAAVNRELATGVRNDSLFLGITFGIDQEQFYDICWDLNKREIVSHGPENMSVQYLFKDSLDQQIAFNFYSEQTGDKIHKYNTSFYYYGWAPWNKHLQSDDLLEALPGILMGWHGGNEPVTKIVDGKKHYYKVDGNRMIDLFILSERIVAAKYIDLAYYSSYGEEE